MKKGRWIFLFPIALFAFLAPAIQYVGMVFTTDVRWAFAGALVLGLIVTGRMLNILRYDVGLVLAIYVGWCISTYFWSEVPDLTLAKGFALALVSFGFAAGGQYWVARLGWRRTTDYLFPVVALALVSAVQGQESVVVTGGFDLYRGLTGNSNMLGSLMNMALPCLLWQAYRYRDSRKGLGICLALLALVTGVLLLSISRASMLAFMVTCAAFLATIGIRRNVALLAVAGISIVTAVIAIPDVFEVLEQRYVKKSPMESDEDAGFSRQQVWEESYDQAVKGGIVGGGYGVTIGDTDFSGGLTAVGYGREKGNSQLAVVEESGLVGLALYIAFLGTLFRRATMPILQTHDRDMRVMGALILGSLAGQIVQSIFEAWFVAPGSPEAAYFWALCGVAIGLSVESRKRMMAKRREAEQIASHHLPQALDPHRRGS